METKGELYQNNSECCFLNLKTKLRLETKQVTHCEVLFTSFIHPKRLSRRH